MTSQVFSSILEQFTTFKVSSIPSHLKVGESFTAFKAISSGFKLSAGLREYASIRENNPKQIIVRRMGLPFNIHSPSKWVD
jgi:hypothetical protein